MALPHHHDAGAQQKDQHNLAELRFIEPTVEFETQPGAGEQDWKPDGKQPDDVVRNRALGTKPGSAHRESGDPNGLKYGALLILGPATQLAPDDCDDAGKAGRTSEHAIEQARSQIARQGAGLDWCYRGPQQTVQAEHHQNYAHATSQIIRISVSQYEDAEWYAESSAND